MSINLDKVIQSLMQLISLAGIKFTGDDESLLLDALTRYHNDHSIVNPEKRPMRFFSQIFFSFIRRC